MEIAVWTHTGKKGHFLMTDKEYFGIFWVNLPEIFFILNLQADCDCEECTQQTQKARHISLHVSLNRSQITKAPEKKKRKKGNIFPFSKCLQLA